ncbi:MAG: alpha-amylase family glycosyl hydrolase, partial [Aquihabitans sp.]
HPWFLRSKASRSNPKSDWYIWRDGRGKGGRKPPNNWRSAMEVKTAWHWGPERQQWYLASFLPFQPDLNYRNPDVKEAMFDAVRFWLRRGVDGFRLDIFGSIMKDPEFRNNPWAPDIGADLPRLWERRYTENTEDTIQFAKDLRAVADEFDGDRVLLGEVFGLPEVLRRYLGDDDGLHLVFLFDFLAYKYRADFFRSRIESYERNYPAPLQPTYVLENHDRGRSIDRVHGDLRKAQTLAVLLCTLRGVPAIYQGQEIGMTNTAMRLSEARDPIARTYFSWVPEAVVQRLPERLNRDEVRTPMQWTPGPNAGFTAPDAIPWLPVNQNHRTRNVESQIGIDSSMLELYRLLLQLRAARASLHRGSLELLPTDPASPDVLVYLRSVDGISSVDGPREPADESGAGLSDASSERTVVAINFGSAPAVVTVDRPATILVATNPAITSTSGQLSLPAYSAAVLGTD